MAIEIYTSHPVIEINSSPTVTSTTTFLGLTDTPASYVGQSLKTVRVNAGETALEFVTASGGNPFADNTAILKNNSDNTKLLKFDLSQLTTATTRTYIAPDSDGYLIIGDGTNTHNNITTINTGGNAGNANWIHNIPKGTGASKNSYSLVALGVTNPDSLSILMQGNATTGGSPYGYIRIGFNNTFLTFVPAGTANTENITFVDTRTTTRGIEYNADYSAGYTSRSLVDKGYVTSLTGATGAWTLASGGTLTGANTITANTANWLTFNGAWATTSNASHFIISPTITNTSGNSVINGVLINPTFVTTAGAPTYYPLRVQSGGVDLFSVSTTQVTTGLNLVVGTSDNSLSSDVRFGSGSSRFGFTNSGSFQAGLQVTGSSGEVRLWASTTYFPTFYSNAAEVMRITSSTGNVLIGTTTDDTVSKLQVNGSIGILTNGANATSTLTQASSFAKHFKTSLWSGSAETKGWFTWRANASTSVNLARDLSLYTSSGASPTFGTPILSIDGVSGVTSCNYEVWLLNDKKLRVYNGGSGYAGIGMTGTNLQISNLASGDIIFVTPGATGAEIVRMFPGVGVGISDVAGGLTITNSSCLLDLQSTSRVLKLSTVASASVATPTAGMLTSDGGVLKYYTGATWTSLGAAGTVSISGLTVAAAANTINNTNYEQQWQWNTLAAARGLYLYSSNTTAASNTQVLFEVETTGANGTAGQTTYGARFTNTHSGGTPTNIAAYFSATSGTTNYAQYISAGNIFINNSSDIELGTGAGTKIGTTTSQKLGFWNATPVVQQAGFTAITHTAPGTPDYAIQDLVASTGFGFVTKDEGNTVLKVIKAMHDAMKLYGLLS